MFRKPGLKLVSASEVLEIQKNGPNPANDAEREISAIRWQYLGNPTNPLHPWAAPDKIQVQLAYLGQACLDDWMAEGMITGTRQTSNGDTVQLPAEIEPFVRDLSNLAKQKLAYAKTQVLPVIEQFEQQYGIDYDISDDQETKNMLYLGNTLPIFPEYPKGYERKTPLKRSRERGTITVAFVNSFNEANLHVWLKTDELCGQLQGFLGKNTPDDCQRFIGKLRSDYINVALDSYSRVREMLTGDRVGSATLSEAYEATYATYVDICLAFLALSCPALLPTERPMRPAQ